MLTFALCVREKGKRGLAGNDRITEVQGGYAYIYIYIYNHDLKRTKVKIT